MGFDELFEMDIEDSSVLAGDHSSGDYRSSAGTHIAGNIESRTPSGLGGMEEVFTINPILFRFRSSCHNSSWVWVQE